MADIIRGRGTEGFVWVIENVSNVFKTWNRMQLDFLSDIDSLKWVNGCYNKRIVDTTRSES